MKKLLAILIVMSLLTIANLSGLTMKKVSNQIMTEIGVNQMFDKIANLPVE